MRYSVRVRWRSDSLRRCSSTCACSSWPTAAVTCSSISSEWRFALRACSFAFATSRSSATMRAETRRVVGARASSFARSSSCSSSREPPHVLAVHALRHVLERAHRLVARFSLRQSRVPELEQRDERREALDGSRAEHLLLFVERDAPPRGFRRRARRAATECRHRQTAGSRTSARIRPSGRRGRRTVRRRRPASGSSPAGGRTSSRRVSSMTRPPCGVSRSRSISRRAS